MDVERLLEMPTTKEEYEQKLRVYIKKFLYTNKFITKKNDVFFARKAFVAASVLRYALTAKKVNKITDKQLNLYFKALSDYKLGKIDLIWQNGTIKFSILALEGENNNAIELITEIPEDDTEEYEEPQPPSVA